MKNMSQRERVMMLFVVTLGPLIVAFVSFQWANDKIRFKRGNIATLENQLHDMDRMQARLTASGEARRDYLNRSLAPSIDVAKTEYKSWLLAIANDHLEFIDPDVTIGAGRKVANPKRGYTVYETVRCTLNCVGTLPQLTQFLNEYYDAEFVHRIVSLNLVPVPGAGDSRDRSGEKRSYISITLQSEAVCMPDAEVRDENVSPRSPLNSEEVAIERNRRLLTRDVFNPQSELPSININGDGRYYEGEDVFVTVSGSDDDILDTLSFEIDESSLPEELVGKLDVQRNRNGINISAPALALGRYSFDINAYDNGSPPEMVTESVSIRFEEREERNTQEEVVEEFDIALASKVTALVRGTEGKREVWIDVKPEETIYHLNVGDPIEIGSVKGMIHEIVGDTVTIAIDDGPHYRYTRGDFLSDPEVIPGVSTDGADTID